MLNIDQFYFILDHLHNYTCIKSSVKDLYNKEWYFVMLYTRVSDENDKYCKNICFESENLIFH